MRTRQIQSHAHIAFKSVCQDSNNTVQLSFEFTLPPQLSKNLYGHIAL